VLLFLRRTLTSGIFRELLLDHPTAADIYVSYLREAGDDDELSTTLL
jgi:hypothetical protein